MPTTSRTDLDLASCPHDRGPGIAVCLRCRAESHRKAAESRRRIGLQAGIGTMAIAVAIIGGNKILAARTSARTAPQSASASSASAGRTERFTVARADAEEATPAAGPAMPAPPALAPVIGAGHTDMRYGRFVDRAGDSVTVHFDTPVFRTRRRDKFEQVVRATLPLVYGTFGDSVLAAVPAGTIADNGDLLAELPQRGIQLPSHEGWTMTLWPGLRPGQDGPLVVSYRISVARAQQ